MDPAAASREVVVLHGVASREEAAAGAAAEIGTPNKKGIILDPLFLFPDSTVGLLPFFLIKNRGDYPSTKILKTTHRRI